MWAVKKLERHRGMSPQSSSPHSRSSSRDTFFSQSPHFSFLAICLCLSLFVTPSWSRACGKDDWLYSYTECDSRGQRWRVAVPKEPNDSPCEILKSPVAGKTCSFSCEAGKYMAVQGDQECHSKSFERK